MKNFKQFQSVKSKFPNMYEALTNIPGCCLIKVEFIAPYYIYVMAYSNREAFNNLISKVHAINAQYHILDDYLKLEYKPELKLLEDKQNEQNNKDSNSN